MLEVDEVSVFPEGFATDAASLARAARDFGGLVVRPPLAVVTPRDIGEVVSAVGFANANRLPVSVRGQGHTTRGQSLATDGIVIDTGALASIRLDGSHVVVGSGARWDAVLALTVEQGKTPPVLTDYLGLSVGGTLSVGGVGGQSFARGLQTGNVSELTVVTGKGEVITCSPTSNGELFDGCLGTLGQCAIIVDAKLSLVDAPARARVLELSYRDAASMLLDQQLCAESGRFDYILASTPVLDERMWGFELEVVRYHRGIDALLDRDLANGLRGTLRASRDLTFSEHATRLAAFEGALAHGAHHPWMDLFVPGSAALEIVELAHRELDPRDFSSGHLMTYPLLAAHCERSLMTLSEEPFFVLFDVLPTVERSELLPAMERRCERIFERARSLGARCYPIGYPVGTAAMGRSDWRRQYDWERLERTKLAHDPLGLLTTHLGLFDL